MILIIYREKKKKKKKKSHTQRTKLTFVGALYVNFLFFIFYFLFYFIFFLTTNGEGEFEPKFSIKKTEQCHWAKWLLAIIHELRNVMWSHFLEIYF